MDDRRGATGQGQVGTQWRSGSLHVGESVNTCSRVGLFFVKDVGVV